MYQLDGNNNNNNNDVRLLQLQTVSDNDSNIIHVVWYFSMLYNCLVVLLSCIISTDGCIAINILSYLISRR